MPSVVAVVCLLTFVHYVAAQMRGPVLPLYAVAHGASATGVGIIVGSHMAAAALGSIPLGRAADLWGRRVLLLGGMAVSMLTSLLLPLVGHELALAMIYGIAGLGVAAFTPSALAVVGDAAGAGRAGHAFAWYTTAHYAAIALGPFIGGVVADWWGYRASFVVSGAGVAVALLVGGVVRLEGQRANAASPAPFAAVRRNRRAWAGWTVALGGLVTQGVFFTFFPLLANDRRVSPAAIGFVFLVLGAANVAVRFPAGWLVDRTRRHVPYAVGGIVVASILVTAVPHVVDVATMLALVAAFGATNGLAGVACGVGLAAAATPATRGLVMGGYSTALYLGLAIGAFAFGPVISDYGYAVGFGLAGAVGVATAVVATLLWSRAELPQESAKLAPETP